MEDELQKQIDACDTYFYESSSEVGLAYYAGNTDEERMKSMVDEYLVATAGAKSVAVTPIVFTALMKYGVDTSNCVVDPFQSDVVRKPSINELRSAAEKFKRSKTG